MKTEMESKWALKKTDATVLVAKSEPFTCEVLGSLLKTEGFDVVGRASKLDDLISKIQTKKPACVITEVGLIGDAAKLMSALSELKKVPKVVMYVNSHDTRDISKVLEAKFSAYLHAEDQLEELYHCLQSTRKNDTYYSACFKDLIHELGIKEADTETLNVIKSLTKREREVLYYLTKGMTGHEVAAHLNMSYRTLATHKQNITQKFSLDSGRNLLRQGLQIRSFLTDPQAARQ
ncbi:response regulator transcription factor [Persicitalea jodogahamensis]|uniref:DNA-binding response regulator n=1 Tax=Persicitalea jodogahamensis TaxID=402147 RepID=A0A8J3D1C0_9BACT|nr:response regulator transcription factor [Persicitalea jodogahamensis]GHB55662.1 DNA-binding response regulator [Persicitalea jodogahamensis]